MRRVTMSIEVRQVRHFEHLPWRTARSLAWASQQLHRRRSGPCSRSRAAAASRTPVAKHESQSPMSTFLHFLRRPARPRKNDQRPALHEARLSAQCALALNGPRNRKRSRILCMVHNKFGSSWQLRFHVGKGLSIRLTASKREQARDQRFRRPSAWKGGSEDARPIVQTSRTPW